MNSNEIIIWKKKKKSGLSRSINQDIFKTFFFNIITTKLNEESFL